MKSGLFAGTSSRNKSAATAAKLNRWDFMLTGAPLALRGSTGTSINLTATF